MRRSIGPPWAGTGGGGTDAVSGAQPWRVRCEGEWGGEGVCCVASRAVTATRSRCAATVARKRGACAVVSSSRTLSTCVLRTHSRAPAARHSGGGWGGDIGGGGGRNVQDGVVEKRRSRSSQEAPILTPGDKLVRSLARIHQLLTTFTNFDENLMNNW